MIARTKVFGHLMIAAWMGGTVAISAGCSRATAPGPTPAEVEAFLTDVDLTLERVWIQASRAGWVAQTRPLYVSLHAYVRRGSARRMVMPYRPTVRSRQHPERTAGQPVGW